MVVDKIKIKDSEDFDLNENIYKTEFEDDFDDENAVKKEASKKKFDIDEELNKDEEFDDEEESEDEDFEDEDEGNIKKDKKEEAKKKRPITIKPVSKIKPKKVIKIKRRKNEEPERTEKRKTKSSGSNWIWILLIIISLVVIVFLVFKMKPDLLGKKSTTNTTQDGEIAAVVNGEPIYLADINKRYDLLSPIMQQMYSKEFILNQSIDEVLLIQEANKKNIVITEEDIDDEIQQIMDDNDLNQTSLEENLKLQGITMQYLRDAYKKKLMVDELVKQITLDVEVSSQDIVDYYDNNSEIFKEPEKVTARHILISITNRTDEDAKKLADNVNSQLKSDSSNFCDLVAKYSEDPGSKETCGSYTFQKGQMVQEFEDAAFNGKINVTVIVKTQFGYHIMQTIQKTPERIVPLEDVSAKINESVKFQKESALFQTYLNDLREKAQIVNYLENPEAPKVEVTEQTKSEPETPTVPENTNQPETPAVVEGETPTVVEGEQTPSEPEVNEPVAPTTEEETVPVEEVTTPVEATASNELITCLNTRGAIVYGASWKKEVRDQLAIFGSEQDLINFVECDKNMPNNHLKECQEQGIITYPTWVIGENKYSGYKSAEELSALADC